MGGRSKEDRQAIKKEILPFPVALPCKKGHDHVWPTTGPITKADVGSCQVICQFCSMDEKKPAIVEAKWGWHLRRHVYQVHRETHPGLIVPEEWSGKKSTSKGKSGPKKGEKRACRKKSTEEEFQQPAGEPNLQNNDWFDAAVAEMFDTPVAEMGETAVVGMGEAAVVEIGELNLENNDYFDAAAAAAEMFEAGMDDMGVGNDDIDWEAFVAPDAFDPVCEDVLHGTSFFEETLNEFVTGSEFYLS